MNPTYPLILAAEDEEGDRFMLELAAKRAKLPLALLTVEDGRECVDYLSGGGKFADRAHHPLPSLVLLDLKMPRMHGFEVLSWLNSKTEFKNLPTVVLSSSSDDSDIKKARELGAREYLIKPLAIKGWVEILQTLQNRWLTL